MIVCFFVYPAEDVLAFLDLWLVCFSLILEILLSCSFLRFLPVKLYRCETICSIPVVLASFFFFSHSNFSLYFSLYVLPNLASGSPSLSSDVCRWKRAGNPFPPPRTRNRSLSALGTRAGTLRSPAARLRSQACLQQAGAEEHKRPPLPP